MVELADYTDDVLASFFERIQSNLLAVFFPVLFTYCITSADRLFFANCKTLRDHLKKIIKDR